MKNFSVLFFALAVIACSDQAASESSLDSGRMDSGCRDSIAVNQTDNANLTVNNEHDWRRIPEGFLLDSIFYFDSTKLTEIDIVIPVSGISALDNHIRNEANKRKKDYLKDIDTAGHSKYPFPLNDFFMEIATVDSSDNIISYSFHVSWLSSYAAHGFNFFYSYTYDIRSAKEITFNDYFNIQTSEDTLFLLGKINEAIGMQGVECPEIKNMDFNLYGDTISFNFDDYEISDYAHGVIEAHIAKKDLKLVTRKEYQ